MNPTPTVILLIDADNVSADVMTQAVQRVLAEHGQLHVRRAYCTAEVAVKHQALFKRLSVRPMVNLAAGKNSTDIALAVDALDLALAERPQVVYLVSSDSDFAPLVLRLREKGCRVCGIGQQGKTGEETRQVYDDFIDLQHRTPGSSAPVKTVTAPARKAAVKTVVAAKPPAVKAPTKSALPPPPKPAAKKAAASAPARPAVPVATSPVATSPVATSPVARKVTRKTVARKTVAVPATLAARPQPSDTAALILQAVPALRGGSEVALNDVVQALRGAKQLGKHASSLKFFDKLKAEFAVLLHPDRIRWLGAPQP